MVKVLQGTQHGSRVFACFGHIERCSNDISHFIVFSLASSAEIGERVDADKSCFGAQEPGMIIMWVRPLAIRLKNSTYFQSLAVVLFLRLRARSSTLMASSAVPLSGSEDHFLFGSNEARGLGGIVGGMTIPTT